MSKNKIHEYLETKRLHSSNAFASALKFIGYVLGHNANIDPLKLTIPSLPCFKHYNLKAPIEILNFLDDESEDVDSMSMKFKKPKAYVANNYPEKYLDFGENLRNFCSHLNGKKVLFPGIEQTMLDFATEKRKYKQNRKYREEKRSSLSVDDPPLVASNSCESVNLMISGHSTSSMNNSFAQPNASLRFPMPDTHKKEFLFIKVWLNGNMYPFLVDTGSKADFVVKNILPQNTELTPTDVIIASQGGKSSSLGTANIKVLLKDENNVRIPFTLQAYVMSSLNNFAGILGISTLRACYSKNLDLNSLRWEIYLDNETGRELKKQNSDAKYTAIPIFEQSTLEVNFSDVITLAETYLPPKSNLMVTTEVPGIGLNYADCSIILDGNKLQDSLLILPSCVKPHISKNNILTSVQIINESYEGKYIPANTVLSQSTISKLDEFLTDYESFREVISTNSLSPLLSSIDTGKDTIVQMTCNEQIVTGPMANCTFNPCLQTIAEEEENLKYESLNAIEKPEIPAHKAVPNEKIEELLKNEDENIPLELRKQFKEMANIPQPVKDVKFSVDLKEQYPISELQKDLEASESNLVSTDLEYLSKKHAKHELVLPDDYLERAAATQQTILENKTETFSIEDIDLSTVPLEMKNKYRELFKHFEAVFAKHAYDIGHFKYFKHDLQVKKVPPSQKQRYLPANKQKAAQEIIDKFLEAKIIKVCDMPAHVSNLIMVPKFRGASLRTKADKLVNAGKEDIFAFRLVQDLRDLNDAIVNHKKTSTVPFEDIMAGVAGLPLINSADVLQAYFTVDLTDRSQPLTAFYLGNQLYCWAKMSQGLKSSPSSFQKLNETVFAHDIFLESKQNIPEKFKHAETYDQLNKYEDFLRYYFDDSWSKASCHEQNIMVLYYHLYAMHRAGLTLNPSKICIAGKTAKILGMTLVAESREICLEERKIQSLLMITRPTTNFELNSRLCSLLYFAKFIPYLKEASLPLHNMLRSDSFVWGDNEEKSWRTVLSLLAADTRLVLPKPEEKLVLACDASKLCTSAILFVERNGSLRIVGAHSSLFSYNDSLKISYLKETIGVIKGLTVFLPFISQSLLPLTCLTDARGIMYVVRQRNHSLAAFHMSSFLSSYVGLNPVRIVHISGPSMICADIFSRSLQGSRFKNYTFPLSKEKASILPIISNFTIINEDILYKYLTTDSAPENDDKWVTKMKPVTTARPLKRLLKLTTAHTSEEATIKLHKALFPKEYSLSEEHDTKNQFQKLNSLKECLNSQLTENNEVKENCPTMDVHQNLSEINFKERFEFNIPTIIVSSNVPLSGNKLSLLEDICIPANSNIFIEYDIISNVELNFESHKFLHEIHGFFILSTNLSCHDLILVNVSPSPVSLTAGYTIGSVNCAKENSLFIVPVELYEQISMEIKYLNNMEILNTIPDYQPEFENFLPENFVNHDDMFIKTTIELNYNLRNRETSPYPSFFPSLPQGLAYNAKNKNAKGTQNKNFKDKQLENTEVNKSRAKTENANFGDERNSKTISEKKAIVATEVATLSQIPQELFQNLQNDCINIQEGVKTGKYLKDRTGLIVLKKDKTKTALPALLVTDLVRYVHKSFKHPSAPEICRIIRQYYDCENLRDIADKEISSCIACVLGTSTVQEKYKSKSSVRTVQPSLPGESISIDIISSLPPVTINGYNGFLLMVDIYSQKSFAALIKSKSRNSIYGAILSYILQNGIPANIVSDSDHSIIAAVQLLQSQGFPIKLHVTPRACQWQNRVENFYKSLKKMLEKNLVDATNSNWVEKLAQILDSLNAIPLTTHGFSRNQMHFGHHYSQSKLALPFTEVTELSEKFRNEIVLKRQLKHTDETRPQFKCKEGDIVFLSFKNFGYKSEKIGPFKIISIDEERSLCTLLDLKTNRERKSNFTHVIPLPLRDCVIPTEGLMNKETLKRINPRNR